MEEREQRKGQRQMKADNKVQFRYEDIEYLSVPLPEDIEKLKWFGDFERAQRVIDMRLEKDIPEALRKRLVLEKEILARMPQEYIYTQEEALRLMRETVYDVTEEELENLRDEGAVEWIYVGGQVHYKDDFLDNLIKTRPAIVDRLKDPQKAMGGIRNRELLDETIAGMKANGGLAYYMRVRSSLKLNMDAAEKVERVRVHLPLPVEQFQIRHVKVLCASQEMAFVSPENHPQRTIYMETDGEPAQGFFVEYELENHMSYIELQDELVSAEQPNFYLEEQMPHIRFTPYLRDLTRQVVGKETNSLAKARLIYEYITTHITYSFVRQYFTITDLPEYMATSLKGDCGLYAILFITMCRIAGVPARWQAGLYATPYEVGNHDWAQFYAAPYGWLYADCSFGGAAYRMGAEERWRFYFGNLDPFRIPCCSEFQKEFEPKKYFLRNDPYDNQNGEAECSNRGLIKHVEYETTQEMIEIRQIPTETERGTSI